MRPIIASLFITLIATSIIGQSAPPPERFSLEGAITIGNSDTPLPPSGTIRWNPDSKDFEGYTGSQWLSLTSGASEFGEVHPYRYESLILYDRDGLANENFGEDVATEGQYYVVGTPETNAGEGTVFLYEDGDLITEIEQSGSQEFGEKVEISGDWIAIGADDNHAYVYSISAEKLEQLKLQTPVNLTEFVAIDGELLAVKGADSTIYTFLLSGGGWEELGQTSTKEVASSLFDISKEGHMATSELGETHVITFRYQNGNWVENQIIQAPTGFKSGKPSLYDNTMVINYLWISPGPPLPPNQVVPEQGFIKVFTYNGSSWVEQTKLFIPNAFYLSAPLIEDDIIIVGSDVGGANSGQVLHNGQGKVHVIKKTGSTWNYKYTLTSSDGKAGDIFGIDYDIGSDGIIVGALWADMYIGTGLESASQGKAYIFNK